jgi:hypothetical protein
MAASEEYSVWLDDREKSELARQNSGKSIEGDGHVEQQRLPSGPKSRRSNERGQEPQNGSICVQESHNMCEESSRRGALHEKSALLRPKTSLRICTSSDRVDMGRTAIEASDPLHPEQRDCEEVSICNGIIGDSDLATTSVTATTDARGEREPRHNGEDYLKEVEDVWKIDHAQRSANDQPMRIAQFVGSPIGRLKRSHVRHAPDEGSDSLADEADSGDDENCLVAAFSPVLSPLTVDGSEFFANPKITTKVQEESLAVPVAATIVPKGSPVSLGVVSTFLSLITCTAGTCDHGNPLESPPAKPMASKGTTKLSIQNSQGPTERKTHPSSCLNKSTFAKDETDQAENKKKFREKQVTWFINPCAGQAVDDLCYKASSWDFTSTRAKREGANGGGGALAGELGGLNIEHEINQFLGRCYGSEDDVVACWQVLVPRQHGMCGVSSCTSDVVERQCANTCANKAKNAGQLENDIGGWDMYTAGKLRNRAGDLHDRQEKVRSMQYSFLSVDAPSMSYTDGAGVDPRTRKSYAIEHGKSFDEDKFRKSRRKTPTPGNGRSSSMPVTAAGLPGDGGPQNFWPLSACGHPALDSDQKLPHEDETIEDEEENDLCYDSDPSDLKSTRRLKTLPLRARRRLPRRSPSHHQALDAPPTDECDSDDEDSLFSSLSQQDLLDLSNPEMIRKFIEETTNRKMQLIWHTAPNPNKKRNKPPVQTCAWIEMGCVMKRQLIYPKFSWKKQTSHSGTRNKSKDPLHSIELLHICRVHPLSTIDRTLYPFAKKDHCFVVESFQQKAMFEARSKKERDRIVKGLKITVARLGSMIIVGDETVFDAFFSPAGCEVPGEAPAWAKNG